MDNMDGLIINKKPILDYFLVYTMLFILILIFTLVFPQNDKSNFHELTLLPYDYYTKEPIEKFSYSIEKFPSGKVVISNNATYNTTLKIPIIEDEIYLVWLWGDDYYVSKTIPSKISSDNATKYDFYAQMYRKGTVNFNQEGTLSNKYLNLTLSSDALVNDPLYCYSGYGSNISIKEAVYSSKIPKEFQPLNPKCFIFYSKLENNSIKLEITAYSNNKILFTIHDVDYFKANSTWNRDIEDLDGNNIGGKTFVYIIE